MSVKGFVRELEVYQEGRIGELDRLEVLQTVIYPLLQHVGYQVFNPKQVKVLSDGYKIQLKDEGHLLAEIHLQGRKPEKEAKVNILTNGNRFEVFMEEDGSEVHVLGMSLTDEGTEKKDQALDKVFNREFLKDIQFRPESVRAFLIEQDDEYVFRQGYVNQALVKMTEKVPEVLYEWFAEEIRKEIGSDELEPVILKQLRRKGMEDLFRSLVEEEITLEEMEQNEDKWEREGSGELHLDDELEVEDKDIEDKDIEDKEEEVEEPKKNQESRKPADPHDWWKEDEKGNEGASLGDLLD